MNRFLLFTAAIILTSITYAQTGPAGVGNATGTNGQPQNVMWFDAKSLGLSNGSAVETWTDISGNNNHATQSTVSSRPTFTTGQINGLPAIVFDGSDDYLPFNGNLITNSDYTVIFVGKRQSNASSRVFMGGTEESDNQNLYLYWFWSSRFTAGHYGNNLSTAMVNSLESYSAGRATNEYGAFATLLASSESNNQRRNYQNNHHLGNRSNSTQLSDYPGAAFGRYVNDYHNVSAAEVIFYSNALNDAQLQIVYQYLNEKYNITIDNDLYNPASTHNYDIIGVGTSDGTKKHAQSSGSSGGVFLYERNNSFDNTDEYVFASHNNTTAAEVTSDLPTLSTGSLEGRSARQWYIHKTGTSTDISIGFELTKTGLGAGNNNQLFYLLFKANTGDSYTTVTGGVAINDEGEVVFNIENANFASGYYTIARSNKTAYTWYSYQSGDWNNWKNWSLEAGGIDIVNPNGYTPSTSPTASVDKVVILHPYQITVSTNSKENAILEVRDGVIDFGNTTGHNFSNITGQGTIKLSADNFPLGNATDFNGSNGGTVEYYGTGHTLNTAQTFNNLNINLANTTAKLILLADYTLNGNLTVTQGIFQINDDTEKTPLTLDIANNVEVNSTGSITVGKGNTAFGYSTSFVLPSLGKFHFIFHNVRIGGNFTNSGVVNFTNQDAPDYGQFTSDGAATVTFYGNQDNTATLHSKTRFYNLIVDKGVDQTYILTLYSDHDNNFGLYGPNNVGKRTGGVYTEADPEVRKSLWIKTGTLKLDGYISIPSLTEGFFGFGSGDYLIPAKGCLWIAGQDVENVKVFSTAQTTSPELISGTSGVANGPTGQALSVFGKFKMTNGYFGTRNSAGFIFWADENAVVEISGGLIDVSQFRSANFSSGGKTSFNLSGGELIVRGSEQFTYNLDAGTNYQINPGSGGQTSNGFPIFGIIDEDGVFQMSGGKLYIAGTSGNNEHKSNGLCINAKTANHQATGGDVIFLMGDNDDYDIKTNGELYNLELVNRDGGSRTRVHMGSDLTLKGNLKINNNVQLIARREHGNFNGTSYNLEVARTFQINSGGDYRPRNNTTTLLVTNSSSLTLDNTNQEFFNLTIKNNPDVSSTTRYLKGNSNTITIYNNLTVEPNANFTFSTGDKTILVKGNLANSGTINNNNDDGKIKLANSGIVNKVTFTNLGRFVGVPTITISAPSGGGTQATAKPVFNGVPSIINSIPLEGIVITNPGSGYKTPPTISFTNASSSPSATVEINTQHEISGDGSGSLHNLEIDETHPDESAEKKKITYLSANTIITGTLTLTNGILDLETFGLDLEGNLTSNSEASFSETNFIRMEGNHADGGLTRYISANGNYLYPIGTYNENSNENRYAWAKPTISSFTNNGKLQINAVPKKLPTLGQSSPDRFLRYYWRTRYSEFSSVPQIQNKFNSYVNDYTWSGTHTNYKIGKVVGTTRYGDDNPNDLGTLEAASGNFRLLNYSIAQNIEDGSFTAAFAPYFNGTIEVFYSKQTTFNWYNWNWNDGTHWSYVPHGEANRTNAGDYPQTGDIAIIGYGDHSPTGQHSIRITSGVDIECAEVRFASYDEGSSRLVVYSGASLKAGLITGNGTFMIRPNMSGFPIVTGDFSEFVNTDVSYFSYYLDQTGHYNIPSGITTVYPNLRFEGGANRSATIHEDFLVKGDMVINGDAEYITSEGTEGDGIIKGTLYLGGYLGGTFSFNTSGTERTMEFGNIYMRNDYPLLNHRIRVLNTSPSQLTHRLIVNGDIKQYSATGGINLFTNNSGGNNVLLEFRGESDNIFFVDNNKISSLYRLIINKGFNQDYEIDVQAQINLGGNSNGDFDEKPIYLQAGTLKLNHPNIDVTINSGGDDFVINSNSKLWVNKGIVRVTSPTKGGIFLDGTLAIEGEGANQGQVKLDGGVSSDNYIEYSSSGNALLRIAGGHLWVGSQIRSSTQNNLGVLHYQQINNTGVSGFSSEVYVGMRGAPEGSRALLEVFNPGSQFQIYNGTLHIARTHDDPNAATRSALYLNPQSTGLNKWGTIQIGLNGTTPANSTIEINAKPNLCKLVVDGGATAQLKINSLGLKGELEVKTGAAFNGNNLDLTLYDNIINNGTTDLVVDTLLFVGNEQEISGDVTVTNMDVDAITSVTVNTSTNVTVNNKLIITNGTLYDNNEIIVVKGDFTNNATHNSTGTGRIKLAGTTLQGIDGNGSFGNLELDNTFGARLKSTIELSEDFYLTNGILNTQNYNFILSENSTIQGSNYSGSKMIASNGSYADLGLTKKIRSGAQTLLFPIGVISGTNNKYTPVSFNITASSSAGSIRVNSVNQNHMTATGTDVLQYFWTVNSTDLSGFTAEMILNYLNTDVVGTEADYISARLYNDLWTKFSTSTVDESTDQITYTFPGVNNISGDFTAGIDAHIPTIIPIFESTKTGDWTDVTLWHNADGITAPIGGPNGHIVRITEGTTVNMDRFRVQAYRTELEGRLEVGTYAGHNIGKVSGGGTLVLESEKFPVADLSAFMTLGTGSTIEYSGGTYSIPEINGNTYNNLTISGTGTKTLPHKFVYIRSDLNIIETSKLKTSYYLYLYKDFTLGENATYAPGHYTVFLGNKEQNIYGDFTGTNSLKFLYLTKSSDTVTLHGNMEVQSICYLRGGVLKIDNGYSLNLKMGIYSGSESYINSGKTWIDGRLTIPLNNGSSSSGITNLFPIGKNGQTRFVRLNNVSNNGTAKSSWTAEYFDTNPDDEGYDIASYENTIQKVGAAEYWMVSGPSGGQTSVSVEWGIESGVDPAYLNDLLLAEWNGSQWINKGGSAVGNENSGIISNTTISTFNTKGVDKYFTLASSSTHHPLPISLLSFNASVKNNNEVEVKWITATETNNDYFIVERSTDGVLFSEIARISGAGTSLSEKRYVTLDSNPLVGISYYRLRQVDFNGQQEVFPMVAVEIEGLLTEPRLNIHPNPFTNGDIRVDIDFDQTQDAFVMLTDVSGNKIWSGKINPTRDKMTEVLQPLFNQLQPGFYIVVVANKNQMLSTRIVKK